MVETGVWSRVGGAGVALSSAMNVVARSDVLGLVALDPEFKMAV